MRDTTFRLLLVSSVILGAFLLFAVLPERIETEERPNGNFSSTLPDREASKHRKRSPSSTWLDSDLISG